MRGHLRKMVAYCKYTVFYECSQYEKEMCAVNLFKIFPGHIYLSNYACDANIFKWSNLSVCERDASSQHLTTAVLNKYIDLQELALREAIRAIQLTQAILDTHVFKNGLFLACQITAFFLIFRGGSIDLNSNYVPTIYMVYNIFFTSLPVIFRIFYASDIYVDPTKVAYIRVNDLLLNFCLAYILGISVTLLAYFLVRD